MAGLKDLMREYERARFPVDRRLDLHGEGPRVARERALHWIQSHAHESPGEELLLIVERGGRPGRRPSAIAQEITRLLDELKGRLIDGWQPFAPGSVALRVSREPSMAPPAVGKWHPLGEARNDAAARRAHIAISDDIPPNLRALAQQAAELRVEREGHSIRLRDVVLREVWHEAQVIAMDRSISFERALRLVFEGESARMLEE